MSDLNTILDNFEGILSGRFIREAQAARAEDVASRPYRIGRSIAAGASRTRYAAIDRLGEVGGLVDPIVDRVVVPVEVAWYRFKDGIRDGRY